MTTYLRLNTDWSKLARNVTEHLSVGVYCVQLLANFYTLYISLFHYFLVCYKICVRVQLQAWKYLCETINMMVLEILPLILSFFNLRFLSKYTRQRLVYWKISRLILFHTLLLLQQMFQLTSS